MKGYWLAQGLKFLIFIIAAVVAGGVIVMSLWNWLMPTILGLPEVSFIQALGLLVLSKILFSSIRGFGGGSCCSSGGGHWKRGNWKDRYKEKMANMSPEEQEKFKENFKKCCGWEKKEI